MPVLPVHVEQKSTLHREALEQFAGGTQGIRVGPVNWDLMV